MVSPNLTSAHWKATSATQTAEAELNLLKIIGPLHLGSSSLGNVKPTPVPGEGSQAHCKLLTKTHREIEEEHNSERAEQLQLQCHWVQWEGYVQNKFTWQTLKFQYLRVTIHRYCYFRLSVTISKMVKNFLELKMGQIAKTTTCAYV